MCCFHIYFTRFAGSSCPVYRYWCGKAITPFLGGMLMQEAGISLWENPPMRSLAWRAERSSRTILTSTQKIKKTGLGATPCPYSKSSCTYDCGSTAKYTRLSYRIRNLASNGEKKMDTGDAVPNLGNRK
jgi:hypothetical protein